MTEMLGLNDEEVAEKVRSGDKDLYEVLIERYKDKLFRYVRNIVHDDHKTSSVVQDSLVKAYVNLNGFNSTKKFSSWIYRIAHNEAVSLLKKYKDETSFPDQDFESEEDISRDFERKEMVSMVGECLKSMPLKYSEPLSLHFLEEKSYSEISEILRIPVGTVGIRVNRAKKIMKRLCQKK